MIIRGATIVLPEQEMVGDVRVVDGRIVNIAPQITSTDEEIVDGSGKILAAGFIDLQLNGGFGLGFTDNPETIWDVAAQLPQYGVTSFLPTVITSPLERIAWAQDVMKKGNVDGKKGAIPLGLHVEGPYLNLQKKGAHNPDDLRQPNVDEVCEWTRENHVALVTLAPELPNAHDMVEYLAQNGVIVSVGHTMSTFEEGMSAFDAGVRYATHLFNAMPPIHHRTPGVIGALLADERVTIGIIPDGVHVHPSLIKMVWEAAGARVNVVTDSMAAMGMDAGVYQLARREVHVDETTARLSDGTLAGSIVTMDAAVRNFAEWTGCGLADTIRAVTVVPADLLNLTDRGKIAVGQVADLVLLDASGMVQMTWVEGEPRFAL